METRDLPNKLQRRGTDFFISNWRIEVKERFDISAHCREPL
jgi:hypothetical protein